MKAFEFRWTNEMKGKAVKNFINKIKGYNIIHNSIVYWEIEIEKSGSTQILY